METWSLGNRCEQAAVIPRCPFRVQERSGGRTGGQDASACLTDAPLTCVAEEVPGQPAAGFGI